VGSVQAGRPAPLRYYVLPVLYGDRFIARFDPAFDKRRRELTIANWWWEAGVTPDQATQAALRKCFGEFLATWGPSACGWGGGARRVVPAVVSQL